MTYPRYGDKDLAPGLYLGCFHGYKNDEERQATTGFGAFGPAFGPLEFVQTTYVSLIRCQIAGNEEAVAAFRERYTELNLRYWDWAMFELLVRGDVLVVGDMEYGDWSVFYVENHG